MCASWTSNGCFNSRATSDICRNNPMAAATRPSSSVVRSPGVGRFPTRPSIWEQDHHDDSPHAAGPDAVSTGAPELIQETEGGIAPGVAMPSDIAARSPLQLFWRRIKQRQGHDGLGDLHRAARPRGDLREADHRPRRRAPAERAVDEVPRLVRQRVGAELRESQLLRDGRRRPRRLQPHPLRRAHLARRRVHQHVPDGASSASSSASPPATAAAGPTPRSRASWTSCSRSRCCCWRWASARRARSEKGCAIKGAPIARDHRRGSRIVGAVTVGTAVLTRAPARPPDHDARDPVAAGLAGDRLRAVRRVLRPVRQQDRSCTSHRACPS